MKLNPRLLALCLLPSLFLAQIKKDYRFIKHEHNRIVYSGDSASYMKLFRKMGMIESGANEQLRIIHIGGSHVQAGIWSAAFLNAFQQRFITAGGGYFVFPYKIAKTNGQPYATSFSNGKWRRCRPVKEYCQPLGPCALSISTADSSNHFGVRITDKATCKYVNHVKVYHNFNASYSFGLCGSDSVKFKRSEHPEASYTLFSFDMPVDSVCFSLARLDTVPGEFTVFGFSLDNNLAPGFYLGGLGANGASTTSFLRIPNLEPQLTSLQADLYILSLGVNDTQSKGYAKEEYVENYDSLLTILRKASPDAAILLTTTTDNFIRRKTSNRRTISARDAMFELMAAHQIGVWDLFSLMGGYKSMAAWYKAGLAARDKVHFNARGYNLVGALMFDAVMRSYATNRDNQ